MCLCTSMTDLTMSVIQNHSSYHVPSLCSFIHWWIIFLWKMMVVDMMTTSKMSGWGLFKWSFIHPLLNLVHSFHDMHAIIVIHEINYSRHDTMMFIIVIIMFIVWVDELHRKRRETHALVILSPFHLPPPHSTHPIIEWSSPTRQYHQLTSSIIVHHDNDINVEDEVREKINYSKMNSFFHIQLNHH